MQVSSAFCPCTEDRAFTSGRPHDKIPVVKPYTFSELQTFVAQQGQRILGFQLQEVLVNDGGLALGFWKQGLRWWVVDLNSQCPLVLSFQGEVPFQKSGRTKPVGLFLSSHARNKIVRKVDLIENQGRILRIELSAREEVCEIDLHLIPKHPNVVVRAAEKQISWEKIADLPPPPPVGEPVQERALGEIQQEWLSLRHGGKKSPVDPAEQWRKKRDRDLEKKKKALLEIEKQLATSDSSEWFERGERLKAGSEELLDPKQSRAWNIEQAFAKAKQVQAKRAGAIERVGILKSEIEALEQAEFSPEVQRKAATKPLGPNVKGVKGRTLVLENGAVAFIGKSAADNLLLLRKARAWDFWLHLRDEPGAHAIIHREKNQSISDSDFRKVARWLARESSSSKKGMTGTFQVVLTECRHVRPIKGDRLGRVNFHHERQLSVSTSEEAL